MGRKIGRANEERRQNGAIDHELALDSRIGVDVGGVLTKNPTDVPDHKRWEEQVDYAAPGALEGVKRLVQLFGPNNVHIVSKVHLGGSMQHKVEHWLHDTCMVCQRTGLRKDNIHFCESRSGPDGKGKVAQQLRLSHFVDDNFEVLESVFADPCGNSGDEVRRKRGRLFHFARGGSGDDLPLARDLSNAMRPYYRSVTGWPNLLSHFSHPAKDQEKAKVSREFLGHVLAKLSED